MTKIIDAKKASEILLQNDDFLILAHAQPDGDTIGSSYALCYALRSIGKRAKVACSDEFPDKYSYILMHDVFSDFEEKCIITVDVADSKLLGKYEETGNKALLCIDHHATNVKYAGYLFLDTGAAAAENVYILIKEMGVGISKLIADCLFTGITTDTGCFKYMNVTPRTHRIAAELIEYGAEAGIINQIMFDTKKLGYVMLQKLALEGLQMHFENRCALMTVTQEMLKKCAVPETEVEGIAAMPRQIEGVLVGVTVREKKDGTCKISLRSRDPVDSSKICANLGGGGHMRASGCTVKAGVSESVNTILGVIKEALEEIK